ncbi:hypothetical protein BCR33DRAFT_780989 [Rhizoclosmatium globosum]|uniref:DUF300-domain-containing protein n=1 Tax=Rhizoclosmatium globosum TaxID=329046 RepID=A0A1Y2CT16_9FUNG|nr:hypothetical protein BCR33DRAFT_780989 [Rhizoclosmatium globosum]|eukprot:ORY50210.1 hypothetical protein BCR33DRAFT_780989 [Rhizoclosmatium globosum]
MNLTSEPSLFDQWLNFSYVYDNDIHLVITTTIPTSILLIIALIALVFRGYAFSKVGNANFKKAFNLINILLMSMILTNCLSAIFISAHSDDKNIRETFDIIASLTADLFQFLIVIYAWQRVLPVIQTMLPKRQRFLTLFLQLFTLIQVSQFIVDVIHINAAYAESGTEVLNSVANALSIAINICILGFDLFATAIYVWYIQCVKTEVLDFQRMLVLSRYGVVSSLCLMVWQSATVSYNYLFMDPTQLKSDHKNLFQALLLISNLTPIVYLSIQLAMKWELQRETDHRIKKQIAAVETAIQKTSSNSCLTQTSVARLK